MPGNWAITVSEEGVNVGAEGGLAKFVSKCLVNFDWEVNGVVERLDLRLSSFLAKSNLWISSRDEGEGRVGSRVRSSVKRMQHIVET